MADMTDRDRAEISRRAAYVLSLCGDELDVRELLGRTYCEFMQGRTGAQGKLVAGQVLAGMSGYEEHIQAVQEAGPGEYLASRLFWLLRDRPVKEQCGILNEIVRAVKRVDAEKLFSSSESADKEDQQSARGSMKAEVPGSGESVWDQDEEGRKSARKSMKAEVPGSGEPVGDMDEKLRDKLILDASQALSSLVSGLVAYQMQRELRNAGQQEGRQGKSVLYDKLDRSFVTSVTTMIIYTMQQCSSRYGRQAGRRIASAARISSRKKESDRFCGRGDRFEVMQPESERTSLRLLADMELTLEETVILSCHEERIQCLLEAYQMKAISYGQLEQGMEDVWPVTLALLLPVHIDGSTAEYGSNQRITAILELCVGKVLLSEALGRQIQTSMTVMLERVPQEPVVIRMSLPMNQDEVFSVLELWQNRLDGLQLDEAAGEDEADGEEGLMFAETVDFVMQEKDID